MMVKADRCGGLLKTHVRDQRPGDAVQNDAESLRKKPVRDFLRLTVRQIGKARGGIPDGINAFSREVVFQQVPHARL